LIAGRRVLVEVVDAPEPRSVTLERIDEEHANAKAEWQRLGSPEYPSRADVERLEEASRLRAEVQPYCYEGGVLSLEVHLPPHAVAVLTVAFTPQPG
jgi:xylan 1,4-beta-xylosidase